MFEKYDNTISEMSTIINIYEMYNEEKTHAIVKRKLK